MSQTFVTNAEDFDDALADLVAEFKGRGKPVFEPLDMKELVTRIADYVRYEEQYQSLDGGTAADAFADINWCIEHCRNLLGLPDESEDERLRRESKEQDAADVAAIAADADHF